MADNRPREGGRSTFGWLCQVIMQIVVMHILISFWRSKQGNQVTPLSGRKDGSYRNYFRNNELFDVFVYVSEKSYVDFNSLGTDADLVYSAENRVYTHKFNRSFEVEELQIPARSHFFSDEHVNLFATVFLVPHKAYSTRSTPFHKSVLREGFDGHIIVKSLPLITFREVKHEKGVNLVSSDSSQVIPESHELRKHWIPRLDVNVVYDTSVHILDPHDPYYHVYERVDSHKVYDPLLYLSQFWVLEEHYKHVTPEMAGNPLMLNIHFSTCSPTYYLICAQFKKNSETGGLLGQQSAKEFEMFKRTLMTTNIYMLIFSGAFILLHSVFSFFALKNDIQFWHRNDSMEGLSALSVIISFVCDIIVALYIFDSENVSWLIIFEIAIGLVASAWKVSKAIRIRFKRQYPFIELDNAKNYVESNTRKYDHIAIKYMSILMLPCVLGYAIYSLFYDKHKSWYSYIISVAAGSVYTFGFIMMTPQIYINYKLKSVDHLPWRALIYKSLNTFVDDVASFLIEMPWMHRLSCFRDDIIFFCYLYQRWAYRVDPNRPSAWKAPTPEIESSEQEGGKKALDDSASGGRANTHEGPARRR